MLNNVPFLALCAMLLAFSSCQQTIESEDLNGQWFGQTILENNEPLDGKTPSQIVLDFEDGKAFTYQDKDVRYLSSGQFDLESSTLFFRDTINNLEPVGVKIKNLNQDTLTLLMQTDTSQQELRLIRQ